MRRAVPIMPVWLAATLAAPPAAAQPAAIEYVTEVHGESTVNPATGRASFSKRVLALRDARYLVVALALPDSTSTITGVTYAGVALTRLGGQVAPGTCSASLFGLVDPPTAVDREVAATISGAGPSTRMAWAAFDFAGVDPQRPTGGYLSRSGTTGQPSLTIEHAPGIWLVLNACHVDMGGTVQSNYAVTKGDGWTFSGASGSWAVGGVSLLPRGLAPPDAGPPDGAQSVDTTPEAAAATDLPPAQPMGGAEPASRDVDLEVGCACRTGGGGPGGLALLGLVLVATRRGKRFLAESRRWCQPPGRAA